MRLALGLLCLGLAQYVSAQSTNGQSFDFSLFNNGNTGSNTAGTTGSSFGTNQNNMNTNSLTSSSTMQNGMGSGMQTVNNNMNSNLMTSTVGMNGGMATTGMNQNMLNQNVNQNMLSTNGGMTGTSGQFNTGTGMMNVNGVNVLDPTQMGNMNQNSLNNLGFDPSQTNLFQNQLTQQSGQFGQFGQGQFGQNQMFGQDPFGQNQFGQSMMGQFPGQFGQFPGQFGGPQFNPFGRPGPFGPFRDPFMNAFAPSPFPFGRPPMRGPMFMEQVGPIFDARGNMVSGTSTGFPMMNNNLNTFAQVGGSTGMTGMSGMGTSGMGMSSSNMGMGTTGMGMGTTGMGMGTTGMGMGTSNMGMGTSNMGMGTSNMGMMANGMGTSGQTNSLVQTNGFGQSNGFGSNKRGNMIGGGVGTNTNTLGTSQNVFSGVNLPGGLTRNNGASNINNSALPSSTNSFALSNNGAPLASRTVPFNGIVPNQGNSNTLTGITNGISSGK